MKKHQPSLPTARAFVVQLHVDAQVAPGAFKGRVEHLNSGEAEHFTSVEDLLAFMARIVATLQQAEAEEREETT